MSRRAVGWTSLSFLIALVVVYPLALSSYPQLGSIDTVDGYVAARGALTLQKLTLGYGLVFILTLVQVAVFVALYEYGKDKAPTLSAYAMVFLAGYPILNCLLIALQLGLTEQVTRLYRLAEYRDVSTLILRLVLPNAQATALSGLGALPSLFLAVPTLVFGFLLLRDRLLWRIAGVLLLLSGAATLTGLLGIFELSPQLGTIALAAAFLFLPACAFLAIGGLRRLREAKTAPDPTAAATAARA